MQTPSKTPAPSPRRAAPSAGGSAAHPRPGRPRQRRGGRGPALWGLRGGAARLSLPARGEHAPRPPPPRASPGPPAPPTGRGGMEGPLGHRPGCHCVCPLPYPPGRGERQRIEVPPSGRSAGLARPLLPGGSGGAPGCCLTCAPGEPGRSAAGSVRCPRAAPALPPGPAARPRQHARPPHPTIGAAGR